MATSQINLKMDNAPSGAPPPLVYDPITQSSPPQQYGYDQPVISQPGAVTTNTTTVLQVMNQPGLDVAKPPFPQRINAWTTGICDCCGDMGICLLGCFCGPCLACKVAIHMNENCCTPCCGGLAQMRTKLRTMLGIRGSINEDCCAVCCCGPCAVCQMEREMNNWGI